MVQTFQQSSYQPKRDPYAFVKLPDLPPLPDLDTTPSFSEVHLAMHPELKEQQITRSRRHPSLPKVFKYGGHHAVHRLHTFIFSAQELGVLPQQWKDANIVTIFKKKGDKSDCGT